ncbi:MAG: LTA synthase family protein [Lactobacillales bacterium]|nr:LTA synthase family protein [Lactobacillales bacterium]
MRKFSKKLTYLFEGLFSVLLVLLSSFYLQLCQNQFSFQLATNFAFSWHTTKFLLGTLVLLVLYLFFVSLLGSFRGGGAFYTLFIGFLGFADYMKMAKREEPIYPDDFSILFQVRLLYDMLGVKLFAVLVIGVALLLIIVYRSLKASFKLSRKGQILRVGTLIMTVLSLGYIGQFNQPKNLLRQGYNQSALWIPYSQKMNYYNVGFVGGFLYNLNVSPMDKPEGYSQETIEKIVKNYPPVKETTTSEKPNIVFVMSESFSNPDLLKGIELNQNPIESYQEVARKGIRGSMLSQGYGGGTANIEFEALTSFSIEPLNAQLTTPYTQLVPKLENFPSIVEQVEHLGYETTAIHPYNTSMYKREDVYRVLHFNQFLSEKNMTNTEKQENNPYISDESAYKEVLKQLDKSTQPQFVHLVTMQTHMPYENKYSTLDFYSFGAANNRTLDNYFQDIHEASEALGQFVEQAKKLKRPTIIVFWGDHLPGIYDENIRQQNTNATLHQTEFMIYDTQSEESVEPIVTSPIYFSPMTFEKGNLALSGYQKLLLNLQKVLPAFEKNLYYQKGDWQAERSLTKEEQKIYEDYRMIEYDIVAGKQYSLKEKFFNSEGK